MVLKEIGWLKSIVDGSVFVSVFNDKLRVWYLGWGEQSGWSTASICCAWWFLQQEQSQASSTICKARAIKLIELCSSVVAMQTVRWLQQLKLQPFMTPQRAIWNLSAFTILRKFPVPTFRVALHCYPFYFKCETWLWRTCLVVACGRVYLDDLKGQHRNITWQRWWVLPHPLLVLVLQVIELIDIEWDSEHGGGWNQNLACSVVQVKFFLTTWNACL